MKVKYAEKGIFNAEKAARGLIELTNKIRKRNDGNKNIKTK
ncbi:hypothetical protein AB1K84_16910 [Mesobacillus foraminis]